MERPLRVEDEKTAGPAAISSHARRYDFGCGGGEDIILPVDGNGLLRKAPHHTGCGAFILQVSLF
jgi:hypothetical protein